MVVYYLLNLYNIFTAILYIYILLYLYSTSSVSSRPEYYPSLGYVNNCRLSRYRVLSHKEVVFSKENFSFYLQNIIIYRNVFTSRYILINLLSIS